MPNTPVLGLPYPVPADSADVPRDMQALALALDASPSIAPIGAIFLWAVANAPVGWLICNGQLVPAAEYPKLAALLGQAGGNVTIPDLRDRVPVGASATKALGSTGGEETHLLTAAETGIRQHNHAAGALGTQNAGDHAHQITPGGYFLLTVDRPITFIEVARTVGAVPRAITGADGSSPVVTYAAGGTASAGAHAHAVVGNVANAADAAATNAHNNLPPYLSMNYIIRAG